MILNALGGPVKIEKFVPRQVITPGTELISFPERSYFYEGLTVEGDPNLIPENIAKDVRIFNVTGTMSGGEGKHAWKKYNGEPTTHTISFEHIVLGNPSVLQVSCNTLDLTQFDSSFFVGFSGNYYGTATYEFISNMAIKLNSTSYSFTYDPLTAQITINAQLGVKCSFTSANKELKELLGYVVSDNESDYPDEGTFEGYYYKKI